MIRHVCWILKDSFSGARRRQPESIEGKNTVKDIKSYWFEYYRGKWEVDTRKYIYTYKRKQQWGAERVSKTNSEKKRVKILYKSEEIKKKFSLEGVGRNKRQRTSRNNCVIINENNFSWQFVHLTSILKAVLSDGGGIREFSTELFHCWEFSLAARAHNSSRVVLFFMFTDSLPPNQTQ